MAKAVTKTYAMPIQISKTEDGGYHAECTILQGCFVDGDTLEEVLTDIQEAMALYIEASRERELSLEVADKQERTSGANLSCELPAAPEGRMEIGFCPLVVSPSAGSGQALSNHTSGQSHAAHTLRQAQGERHESRQRNLYFRNNR